MSYEPLNDMLDGLGGRYAHTPCTLKEYKSLIRFLRSNGYQVKDRVLRGWKPGQGYRMAIVTGKGIYGLFCRPNRWHSPRINGRFVADNAKCYDKPSSCPLGVNIPYNHIELLRHLEFLATPEGYKHSASFDYCTNPVMPCFESNFTEVASA